MRLLTQEHRFSKKPQKSACIYTFTYMAIRIHYSNNPLNIEIHTAYNFFFLDGCNFLTLGGVREYMHTDTKTKLFLVITKEYNGTSYFRL